jgi:formylmethanofuran dehydrogenase subunit B
VVAGLGADIAGARAAVRLADRVGGSFDHMHAASLLRDLDVMREHGMMTTTPGEARRRGDIVLLVGDRLVEDGLLDIWPDLRTGTLTPPAMAQGPRRIIWLCPGDIPRDWRRGAGIEAETIADDPETLPALIGALRARVNDKPAALSELRLRELDAVAAALKSATFGVVVWSAARLDGLAIEMLCGMVKDLNARTRFTGLPLAPGDNGAGVLQTSGWMTGFPMRTGFARGYPEHDPWLFDAGRLVESGEADCALWISAYRAAAPGWRKTIPLIALTGAEAEFPEEPAVRIAVGRPGVDHDGVAYCARMATLAPAPASQKSDAPSVSEILEKLIVALGETAGAEPC